VIINKLRTNKAICDALGIDPSKVSKVTITLGSDAPMIEVLCYLDVEKTGRLVEVLSNCEFSWKS
jgi:hypothetical protein